MVLERSSVAFDFEIPKVLPEAAVK